MKTVADAIHALGVHEFKLDFEPTTEAEFNSAFGIVIGANENSGAIISTDPRDFPISWAEISAKLVELQAVYDGQTYARNRVKEYPPIGDQLDALWKGGEAAAAMLAQVQAVKAKYPKE